MNSGLFVEKINWINDIEYNLPMNCLVQVRHQHKPVECYLESNNDKIMVTFKDKIRAIAPGQSAVLYDNDICLGGGIINQTF
jgi:tRNA-specific 2-thiouridylase